MDQCPWLQRPAGREPDRFFGIDLTLTFCFFEVCSVVAIGLCEFPLLLEGPGDVELHRFIGGQSVRDQEVIDALLNLGFPRQRIRETLSQVPEEIETSEERIKEALKIIKR